MKHFSRISALAITLVAVSAQAQTNCQKIGNQLICNEGRRTGGLLEGAYVPPPITMPSPSQEYMRDPLGGATEAFGGFLAQRQNEAAARHMEALVRAELAGDLNRLIELTTDKGLGNLHDPTKRAAALNAAMNAIDRVRRTKSYEAEAANARLRQDSRPTSAVNPPAVQSSSSSYSSNSASAWDDQSIIDAVRAGNYTWDSTITVKAPRTAENGAVVPIEVSASREFKPGERLFIVVNDSFIGASLTPVDSRAQLYLSTRVKMPGTGQLKAVLIDSSGQISIAAIEVKVPIGADPNASSGSPNFGKMKLRASNYGFLDIKSLFTCSQSPDLYIKTIGYYVDGIKISDVGLTPGSAKNPYVAIKVSGSGGHVEMQAIASDGQTNRDSNNLR